MQIIQRYLTRRPKSPAACELKALALILKNGSQQGFETALEAWYERHKAFLNERTTRPVTHKSRYSHSRLRSACHSLKRNLPHLFTFERYPDLGIHQHHESAGREVCRFEGQIAVSSRDEKGEQDSVYQGLFLEKMTTRASILSLRREALRKSIHFVPYA